MTQQYSLWAGGAGRVAGALFFFASLAFWGSSAARAQTSKDDAKPRLGLDSAREAPSASDFLIKESRRARSPYETDEPRGRPRLPHYGVISPYYIPAPAWGWYAPQTYKHDLYPPPVVVEPRLGMMYTYPYSWQMGIQMPVEENPLYTYSLGSFQGVVRSPQQPVWLYEQIERGELLSDDPYGAALMREGKFKAAGRIQAEGFRSTDDPRFPLYLAESLFGLEKYEHAELVLRHALSQESAFDVLPDDVASHFSSPADFAARVEKLLQAKKADLLTAYLLLFSDDGSRGLDMLVRLMDAHPKDDVYGRLYRHYLAKAFGRSEEPPEAPAPAPKS
ncbi:MAG: hypothetical protein JXA90_05490 [Planctomycetes bacterium]|nr:hypothetical protein [Planctomycetota bacterium]